MCLNRREFLILSAGIAAGCAGGGVVSPMAAVAIKAVSIDAGPVSQFTADRVYDQFASQGFFIVRKGDQLFALSSICTHRSYRLEVSSDESFYCKAHGSCFDPAGKVTEGPATRDLPKLPTKIDQSGHFWVLGIA